MNTDLILVVFCLLDDILQALRWQEDPQQKMSDSEVLTVAWMAHRFFKGNYAATLFCLRHLGQRLFPRLLSPSRFNRRLHRLLDQLPLWVQVLGELKRHLSPRMTYLVDSFPVAVCQNIRIRRCRLFRDKAYRGFVPSKRVFFFGLRVHVVVDDEQFVYEWAVLPGSASDHDGWAELPLAWPEGSEGIADRAFCSHEWEDALREQGIRWNPLRRKNESRYEGYWMEWAKRRVRRLVETAGSVLQQFWGERIRAVTARGVLLKVSLGILSYDLHRLALHHLQ